MGNGGMDALDWLQSFLPAESLPGHDPNAAHQTHPAFQDAEELARASYMHQQTQNSYSFMRSTNPATSHTLNPAQLYPERPGGQNRGSQRQEARNVHTQQSNDAPPERSYSQPDRFNQPNQGPNSSVSSQYSLAVQAHQAAYRQSIFQAGQAHMGPMAPSREDSLSTPNFSEAGRGPYRTHETASESDFTERTNPSTARPNPPTTRPSSTSSDPYQYFSTFPVQGSEWPAQGHTSEGPMRPSAQVHRTHTPAAQPPALQCPSPNRSTISNQNVQRLAHPVATQGTRPKIPEQRKHTPREGIRRSPSPHQSPHQSHSVASIQPTTQPPPHNAAQRPWPDPPMQRRYTPVERTEASQRPYQTHSATSAQNTRQPSHSAVAQGTHPTPPPQITRTSVSGTSTSQSPHQRHSAIPTQAAKGPDQSHAPPPTSHSVDPKFYTLTSPKGFKTSATRSTLEPRQLITTETRNSESSNPPTYNPTSNHVKSNSSSSGPSQVRVQSDVTAAPNKTTSTATTQPASTLSPSVSFVSAAPIPAHSATSAERAVLPHHSAEVGGQQKHGRHRNEASGSSYQGPKQTSQLSPKSRSNEQSTPAISSASMSTPHITASHSRLQNGLPYNTEPRQRILASSQQDTVGNIQPRVFPLPGAFHHQKKRWVPAQDHSNDQMPPEKVRRLDNFRDQPVAAQNAPSTLLPDISIPGVQVLRMRGPGKILKNRDDLVQPLRRSDALLKESYDPTTIARDVLIAAGKHPTEKFLNHHLEALRRNFTKIDYFADLETFRWDLVDAKQEPQITDTPPMAASQLHHPPISHSVVPHSLHPPQSLPHDHSPPVNHMTSQAPSNHVTMCDTPPSRQVAPPMPVRIDARAPPGGLSAWGTLPFKPPTYHSPHRSFSSNLPSGPLRIDPVPSPKFSQPSVRVPTPAAPSQPRRDSTTKSAAPPISPPAKQVTPKSTPKAQPQGKINKGQPAPGRIVESPQAKCVQPQVVITPSSEKMPAKNRRGRPSKHPVSNVEVAIHRTHPVHYQVFPCKWEECAAELHNINSIRAHVLKIHIPHSLICGWKGCDNKTPMAAANMFEHMANNHISKMAWELGDGPTVPASAETNPIHPSCLSDSSARKATMVLPVDEHQVKAFSKTHGKSTERTKAQALLEAGRHWKQQIGPEMDWSDRRLSTPAWQSRVLCKEMAFVGDD